MVSDTELIDRLREFLRISDLNTTTTAIVRRKLEEDFDIDLSDRKAFIRTQVDLFLQTQVEKPSNEEDDKPNIKSEPNGGASDSEEEESEPEEEEEEEEEDSGEEVSANAKRRKKKVSNNKNKDVKKRGGGFNKICSLSPELQKILGVSELARTEVVRQIWAYIRGKDLQDPENRKNIRCDEALRALFHVDTIDMFQMNKSLSVHILPLNSENAAPAKSASPAKSAAPAKSTPKERKRKQEKHEDSEDKRKGPGTGFLAPLPLSDALVKFIGTGENILPRSAVVKKIWGYIKENNLQDPSDKRKVICDDKLKELFEVDSFVGFTVPKLLRGHFIKAEQ